MLCWVRLVSNHGLIGVVGFTVGMVIAFCHLDTWDWLDENRWMGGGSGWFYPLADEEEPQKTGVYKSLEPGAEGGDILSCSFRIVKLLGENGIRERRSAGGVNKVL